MLGGIPPNPNIILESHLFFFKKERNVQSEGVDAEGFADGKSRGRWNPRACGCGGHLNSKTPPPIM
jgi:hypothetical protein